MTNKTNWIEEKVKAITKMTCKTCNGDGFTSEHDPQDPHEDGCSNCPVQTQCEECHAEGKYVTLDFLRQALLEAQAKERAKMMEMLTKAMSGKMQIKKSDFGELVDYLKK